MEAAIVAGAAAAVAGVVAANEATAMTAAARTWAMRALWAHRSVNSRVRMSLFVLTPC